MSVPRYALLDPVKDHQEIVKWMMIHTWRFDLVRSIEIALLKTFALPEIAKILVDSTEFLGRTQKRYDDTDLLLSLFIENGYSSREGMEALRRVNRMHARHPITNHQMLYVLTTFVVEPILWVREFGWRELSTLEQQALFHFWIAVGKRMGIQDLFGNLDEMLAYHERYEEERMVYSDNNASLYHGVLPVVRKMMPFPLGYVAGSALPGIMSERMCATFGIQPMARLGRGLIRAVLKVRGHISRGLPLRPQYRTEIKRPSYPEGFSIKELGVSGAREPAAMPAVAEVKAEES